MRLASGNGIGPESIGRDSRKRRQWSRWQGGIVRRSWLMGPPSGNVPADELAGKNAATSG